MWRMDMTVFYAGTEVLYNLLKEKSEQHEQPDQFNLLVFPIQLRKNVNDCDTKQVCSRKHQQQLEICRTKVPDEVDQQTRNKRRKQQYG